MINPTSKFVDFLTQSGLSDRIEAYRGASEDPSAHGVRSDYDGHPMLLVQGRWTRWEQIDSMLYYDPTQKRILHRSYPGTVVQSWNYNQHGLDLSDRFEYGKWKPIFQLSPRQLALLREKASLFFQKNPEADPGTPKPCVLQLFSTYAPHKPSLLRNIHEQTQTEVGFRIVMGDGQVYSGGFEVPPEEAQLIESDPNGNKFITANAQLTLGHSKESSTKGKLVTSIPIPQERAEAIKSWLEQTAQGQVRFNPLKQNSTHVAIQILKRAGYRVDAKMSLLSSIFSIVPDAADLPLIGPVADKIAKYVKRVWDTLTYWVPRFVPDTIYTVATIATFVPHRLLIFIANLAIWNMGGGKMTTPLKNPDEDEFGDYNRLLNFSSIIRSPLDLFNEEITTTQHSRRFIEWQLKQPSSFQEPANASPRLAVIPRV